MSGMNEFLADLYKTAETIGATTPAAPSSSDVEKLAQAEVVDQFLQSKGVDVNSLGAEDILKVAAEIFGPNNELAKLAQEGKCEKCGMAPCKCPAAPKKEDEEKKAAAIKEAEAKEKAAEADFLGRQIAHSFVNELYNIEKTGGEKTAGLGGQLLQSAKNWGQLAAHAAKTNPKGALQAVAVPAAALGGTGFLAGRVSKQGSEKTASAQPNGEEKPSALDILAEKYAMEILKANGIEPQQPSEPSEQEKIAAAVEFLQKHGLQVVQPAQPTDEQQKLAAAVEERAWEMLKAAGYQKAE
jgi:hypothetical protein